jgi:hypothetical protein
VNPLKSLKQSTLRAGRNIAETAEKLAKYDKKSDLLQRATDTWLAYQYGVKPLVQDIKGAASAANAAANGHQRYEVQRLIGSGKAEEGTSELESLSRNGFASPGVVISVMQRCTASVRILGGYSVGLDRSPEMGFLDQFGVAPDNWVPTAYELFPWSHVVDYFTNCGSVLDAFSLGSVKFIWLVQTSRFERYLTKDIASSTPNQPGGVMVAFGGQVRLKQTAVHRSGRSNSFSPSFLVKKPSLSQSLNIAAMVNTIQSLKARSGN